MYEVCKTDKHFKYNVYMIDKKKPDIYHDVANPMSFHPESTRNSFHLKTICEPEGAGLLYGGGEYPVGALVTLEAQPSSSRYVFDAWYYQGAVFSHNPFFTFLLEEDLEVIGRFVPSYE